MHSALAVMDLKGDALHIPNIDLGELEAWGSLGRGECLVRLFGRERSFMDGDLFWGKRASVLGFEDYGAN